MAQFIEQYLNEVSYAGGINTQKPVVLSGTSSTLAVGGVSTFTGVATFTAAPVFNGGRTVSGGASSSATVTLTSAQSGGTFWMDRAGGTSYTLPAPVVGLSFRFINTVLQTGGANVIVTNAGSVFLNGSVTAFSGEKVTPSSTLGPFQFAGNGTTHIQVTTNGTTTGGGIGTWIDALCTSATTWYITGVINSPSGNLATPFST